MSEEIRVGPYILVRKIGEGGMAEVWEGRHNLLDTRTAVKFLLPEFVRNKELQERFLNEGKRQAQLQHPNIVPALDFFQLEGRSYLVMRYVDGESLETRLEKHRAALTLQDIHTISWDVASALDYAHSLGVVHRDVKPANMLIDRSGSTLLMDFGIAKALREERSVTLTGTSMGTPDYMSPEQIVDPKRVDARSDIYSFGCVLYAMFAGQPPFSEEGATAFHVQSGHVHSAPPPFVYRNPDVPPAVSDVVLKCLEKDPANRYPSCGAVMTALDQLISGSASFLPPVSPATNQVSDIRPRAKTIIQQKTVARDQTVPADRPSAGNTVGATPSRAATAFIPVSSPQTSAAIAAHDSATGGRTKYLLIAVVLLILAGSSTYFFLHAKNTNHGQDVSGRVQQLRAKDWSAVRYDDAGLQDCMDVQPCLDKKAAANRLKTVNDWKSLRFDDPVLKNCMGFQPCTEQAEHAAILLRTKNWAHADRALLADCMGYAPCVAADIRPEAAPAAQAGPVSAPGRRRSVEDLPSCCSKDSNPGECRLLKKQAEIADCSSPIGDSQ